MKKLGRIFLALLLLCSLCACGTAGSAGGAEGGRGQQNQEEGPGGFGSGKDVWEHTFQYELLPQHLGKDIWCQVGDGTYDFYWNDAQQAVQLYVWDTSTDEFLILRAKKTDGWQNIIEDFDIQWDTFEDATDRGLTGKKGAGTVTLSDIPEQFQQILTPDKQEAFTGAIWYDRIDGMTYAMISMGEGKELRDPYPIFRAESQSELQFASYEEAWTFLETHNYQGMQGYLIFARGSGDTQEILQGQQGETLVYATGPENDRVYTYYEPDDSVRRNRIVTYTEGEDLVQEEYTDGVLTGKQVFDAEGYRKEGWSFNPEDNSTGFWKYEKGKMVYAKEDNSKWIRETWYGENTRKISRYLKAKDELLVAEYKKVLVDGNEEFYMTSKEGTFGYTKYTYVSEDSPYLVRLEDYQKKWDEKVIWTLNGTACDGNQYNVISLERTVNGKTTFYSTPDQIPWGTGMTYPPHFQHELRNTLYH